MAANEYYDTTAPINHIAHQHIDLSQPPSSSRPPRSSYTGYRPSRASYTAPPYKATRPLDSPYHNPHQSQDDRQYAENIPLKSPYPGPSTEDNIAGQDAQYPPSPESQHPPKSSRSRKRKQGWFSGKITWVVYVVTLVQLGVFIGEIVENGEARTFSLRITLING